MKRTIASNLDQFGLCLILFACAGVMESARLYRDHKGDYKAVAAKLCLEGPGLTELCVHLAKEIVST